MDRATCVSSRLRYASTALVQAVPDFWMRSSARNKGATGEAHVDSRHDRIRLRGLGERRGFERGSEKGR